MFRTTRILVILILLGSASAQAQFQKSQKDSSLLASLPLLGTAKPIAFETTHPSTAAGVGLLAMGTVGAAACFYQLVAGEGDLHSSEGYLLGAVMSVGIATAGGIAIAQTEDWVVYSNGMRVRFEYALK